MSHLIDILSQNARNYKNRKKERKKEEEEEGYKKKKEKKKEKKRKEKEKTTSFFFANRWLCVCVWLCDCPSKSFSVQSYPSVQLIKAHPFINYCEASSVTTVCFRVSCLAMLL